MSKVFKMFILALVVFSTINFGFATGAGKLNFDGSGSLAGRISIVGQYLDHGTRKTLKIMDHLTCSSHNDWKNVDIPNEVKYNTIMIYQSISGTPHDCIAEIGCYDGGNVDVDYSITTICKNSGSHLRVTYKNKTVTADSTNDYYAYWSQYV